MSISKKVEEVMLERELSESYILNKMQLFNDEQTRLEQLQKAKFLDQPSRDLFAKKFGLTVEELNGFYNTFDSII